MSARLKELRKEKNVTQVQTAGACKMTVRSYQRLEANSKPSFDTLVTLADYFNVSMDYLAGRTDKP